MSASLYVYVLDLDRFKAVQGSGDRALLRKVFREKSEQIDDCEDVPLAGAVRQIVEGQIDRKAEPLFQFEHAAALIAGTLGEALDAGPFEESRMEFWDEVDKVVGRKLRRADAPESAWPCLADVLTRGPLLRVPLDREDPLGTGYLKPREIVRALKAATPLDLETADGLGKLKWPDEALEGARYYRDWLKAAADAGRGLFLHC